ncbi:hypothetical protein [Mucilaginibacter arboris]|uniref:Uncharacterized protein n=1 Tax=Mucilaginibacter arboris TaxID=2682090 RepID=A0A7K1SUC7_9SPHI|nr:hypothetical protein [Mucilaginibacter arboris]MVN20863.1 hypothetical protein [Mucilaginibacter arboris]
MLLLSHIFVIQRLAINNSAEKLIKFEIMITFTINTEDKKAEKALKAILKALKLDYEIHDKKEAKTQTRPLNKKEKQIFKSLKGSLIDIKRWEKGEIEFKNAKDFLNEL